MRNRKRAPGRNKPAPKRDNRESLKQRCIRLRAEAEAGNDDASATFFTALYQAMTLRITEEVKEANLILLLGRKFTDFE